MNENTTQDTSVKVISDAREEDLLSLLRTLHGKVLTACSEVGQKPTFPQDFGKCSNEDYKSLHQQSRVLISAKRKARWEEAVKGIRAGLIGVTNTYMSEARAKKARYDAIEDREFLAPFPTSVNIPFSALTPAFPQGTTEEEKVQRCKELNYQVGKGDKGFYLKVAFVPAPTQSDTKLADKAA